MQRNRFETYRGRIRFEPSYKYIDHIEAFVDIVDQDKTAQNVKSDL